MSRDGSRMGDDRAEERRTQVVERGHDGQDRNGPRRSDDGVTLRQGTIDHPRVMTTAARRTPADRDRAVARLHTITIGTGLAGVVAVGGFGLIAAHSYDGSVTGVTTAAIVATDITTTTRTTTSDAATPTSTAATTSDTSTAAQATAAPTAATGTAHAASGSS